MKDNIYIHVPYHLLERHMNAIIKNRANIEIYFSAEMLDNYPETHLMKYSSICRQNRIKVILHAPYIDLSPGGLDERVRRITMDRFIHLINIAKIFDAETVVYHTGYDEHRHGEIFEKWLKKSLATWSEVVKIASKNNINVLFENIFDKTPKILTILLREIGSENIGYCFDTGHFNLFSDISLEKWIEDTAIYIKEFHIHNNYGIKDNHNSLSDGTFDFNRLFYLIKQYNILAKLTIEAHDADGVFKSMKYLEDL